MLHNGLSRETCKAGKPVCHAACFSTLSVTVDSQVSNGMSMNAQSAHNAAARADLETLSVLIHDEETLKSVSPSG